MNHIKLIGIAAAAWLASPAAIAETVAPTTGDGIVQLSELAGTENITFLNDEHMYLNRSTNNNPLTIEGTVYESGIGTHAPSVCVVELNGATSFHAILGVDDEANYPADNHGVVNYTVTAYGENISATTEICSGTLNRQTESYHYVLDIADLSAYTYLKLDFATGTQPWADHVDIADARFTYEGKKPVIIAENLMFADTSKIISLPTTTSYEGARIIPMSTLQLKNITNGWGTVRANKSIDNNDIMMKGYRYESGVGLHATARIVVRLNGTTPKFHASLGVDDEVKAAAQERPSATKMTYRIILRKLGGVEEEVMSGNLHANDPDVVNIDLDNLTLYKYLIIEVDSDGSDESDHFDLGNAYFEFIYQNSSEPEIVNESELAVGLDAATTVFSQPGVRFMHKLRSQSSEASISVSDLPQGLSFNPKRNLIEGKIDIEGTYTYNVTVTLGEEEIVTPITLTVSTRLQQPTPFMGWLSWNSVEDKISETVIKSVADQMIQKGLVDAGYNYLVIDDLWHLGGGKGDNATHRTADGSPIEDPEKFPNGMKACADYVHSKGMKFGIYSDAAAKTCAGAFGSLGYETQDANQYAKWEVDLLKYDYCGAPGDTQTAKQRYKAMGDALKASGRDILFYICEWGQRDPWKWGAEVGGTCWRTSYDSRDAWVGQISLNGVGIVNTIDAMKDIWHYNGVNRWNDADMMMIGIHGTGKSSSALCVGKPGMTQDEYRTQFSLWCMWSSPLTLSNDMSQPLSDDDLKIMTNAELLAVNQDRMGQAAETIYHDADDCLILAKDCENGDIVVSVTNLTTASKNYSLDLTRVAAADPDATYYCRDLVNNIDMPGVTGSIDFGSVPTHATVVYRLSLKDNEQNNIDDIMVTEALDHMSVTTLGDSVRVCMPGTAGTSKRILLSDIEGRVVAWCEGVNECFTLRTPARGVYVVNTTCAARSQSTKLYL